MIKRIEKSFKKEEDLKESIDNIRKKINFNFHLQQAENFTHTPAFQPPA
jgi:hypothetical protein